MADRMNQRPNILFLVDLVILRTQEYVDTICRDLRKLEVDRRNKVDGLYSATYLYLTRTISGGVQLSRESIFTYRNTQ
jgi:hypothetical protein